MSKFVDARAAGILIAGLVLVAGLVLASAPFVRLINNGLGDVIVTTISPWTKPPGNIVLVTIGENTLAKFPYRSPVDRKFLAEMISTLLAARPKAIGIDILFDQPSEPAKDEMLRAVLAGASVPVIVARAGAANGLTGAQIKYLSAFSANLQSGSVDLAKSGVDGTVRMLSLGNGRSGVWVPGFASLMAAVQGIKLADPDTPLVPMVYYRTANGEPFRFKQFPAETVRLLPPDWFKDKLVLIGTNLPNADRHRTAFYTLNGAATGDMAGILVHAHALAQLVNGDKLVRPGVVWQVVVVIGLCFAGFAIGRLSLHPILRLLALVALGLVVLLAVMAVFHRYGILLAPVQPVLAIVLAGVAGFVHAWYKDYQQRAFITDAFSRYVSPAYVDRLIAHPDELHLGGERREVSYIFTDIAGFTSLSEQTGPRALSRMLNEYLDGVCGLFLKHGATIDKIIGDAVVGFIGAPVGQEDHAAKAVALVLAVDEFCEAFAAGQRQQGHDFGVTRIGVHTGTAVIGNFGGSQFFDYTGFGDTVNTAARLEGANKYFGTRVCISAATVAASGWPHTRPIGTITLKGKSKGIEVFEPLSEAGSRTPQIIAYGKAFDLLKACDRNSLAAFDKLALDWPQDGLVRYHLERLHNGETGTTVVLSSK